MKESCRLCGSKNIQRLSTSGQALMRCGNCSIVFKEIEFVLAPEEERNRYELHENSIDDPRYVAFLSQLSGPMSEHVAPSAQVLDYGSGPEPVLGELLRRDGFVVDVYDPFFALKEPTGEYDAITLSEVVEHFVEPGKEFERLRSLLKMGGVLGIMTLRYNNDTDFSTWHYVQDETHVAFYSDETFQWVESRFGFRRLFDDRKRVIVLQKV